MEHVHRLLDENTHYAWIRKAASFFATTEPTLVGPHTLNVSNRPAHEIAPGTFFVDASGRGFLFIVPFGSLYSRPNEPTHEVVFALTDEAHRNTGVLSKLMSAVPPEWHLWLECPSSTLRVWESNGFVHRKHPKIRSELNDWGDSIEMERLPISRANADGSMNIVQLV